MEKVDRGLWGIGVNGKINRGLWRIGPNPNLDRGLRSWAAVSINQHIGVSSIGVYV